MLNKELDDIQIDLVNDTDYLSEWHHLGSALAQFDIFSILPIPFPSVPSNHLPRTSSHGLGDQAPVILMLAAKILDCNFNTEIHTSIMCLEFGATC